MLFSQTRHKQNQTHKTIKFIHNLIIHICFGVIFEPFYNACVPLLPSLYWTASLLLHRVSYLRCHCASSPLLSWCCWQVLTMTVESCWRCTCRLQDEGEQRWRNTVKSGMTGERQRESKGDRVCFIWMCTCAQPCLDWSWMFTMGNSQHKLYYSRMQMRKRRCRTVTARQERSNAGTEERWNQKLRNIKTLLHTAGHGGGGDDFVFLVESLRYHIESSTALFMFCWVFLRLVSCCQSWWGSSVFFFVGEGADLSVCLARSLSIHRSIDWSLKLF